EYKIFHEDLLSRILIACADILYFDLKHFAILDAFALASSSNSDKYLRGFVKKVADRVGKPYSEFIDLGLYKSRFSLRLLEWAKEDR
ncbi:3923_t:CDS:2, partial [Racocetra persica]